MITNCPVCSAQYRLNKEKFGGKRVTLKCVQCQKVFQAEVPHVEQGVGPIHVLIAHCDEAICSTIKNVLDHADISSDVCHDGTAAISLMKARAPQVAIVDVALPGLYAFEVVEKVRSVPGLENVKIILLSSVYNKMAYKRTPASLYDADAYIEKHHIPNDLVAYIHRLVTDFVPTDPSAPIDEEEEQVSGVAPTAAEEQQVRAFTDEMNDKIMQAESEEVSPAVASEAPDKAHRLARNIVSDIALYHQEKVEEGVQSGTFYELLEKEIREGRRLFQQRFPDLLDSGQDILQMEIDAFIERRRAGAAH